MKLDSFISQYAKSATKVQEDMLSKVIVNKYVPFIEKKVVCEKIVEASCYKMVGERKVYSPDTPVEWIMFAMRMIQTYTNLEFDPDERIDLSYDKLQEYGLVNTLLSLIQEECGLEYDEFNTVQKMVDDDCINKETNIVAYLQDVAHGLGVTGEIIKEMLEKIDIE